MNLRKTVGRAVRSYALVFPLVFGVAFAVQWMRTDRERDVAIYYRAVVQAVEPGMYEPLPPAGQITRPDIPLYPPPIFAAMRPLTALPYVWFARIWLLAMTIAFWMFAAACGAIVNAGYSFRGTLAAGALLFFVPGVVQSWNMLNVDVLLWACVALGLAYGGSRRGAWLAAGTALKIIPIWALLFALRERRVWRGVLATIAIGLAVMVAGLGVAGAWSESRTWLTRIAPAVAAGESWRADVAWHLGPIPLPSWLSLENMSLPNALAPLFGSFRPLWLRLAEITGPLLTGWLLRSRPVTLQAAGVLAATLLFGPILRLNYLPLLVPCALVWWNGLHTRGLAAETRGLPDPVGDGPGPGDAVPITPAPRSLSPSQDE